MNIIQKRKTEAYISIFLIIIGFTSLGLTIYGLIVAYSVHILIGVAATLFLPMALVFGIIDVLSQIDPALIMAQALGLI